MASLLQVIPFSVCSFLNSELIVQVPFSEQVMEFELHKKTSVKTVEQ